MDKEEAMLTRAQAARLLDVSPERVRQLTVSGRLRCTRTPLGRLYRATEVQRLADERRRAGTPTA
jgi:excisionase family DNA binding protein